MHIEAHHLDGDGSSMGDARRQLHLAVSGEENESGSGEDSRESDDEGSIPNTTPGNKISATAVRSLPNNACRE